MTTEADDNVVPPEEMARRRRVHELAGEIADKWTDIGGHILELESLGVPTAEWVDVAMRFLSQETQDKMSADGRSALAAVIEMIAMVTVGNKKPTIEDYAGMAVAGAKLADEGFAQVPRSQLIDLLIKVAPQVIGMFVKRPETELEPELPRPMTQEEIEHLGVVHLSSESIRMKRVIDRLFAQAPKIGENQAPAIECHVVLKAGQAIQGALSVTPEGVLRLLAMNQLVTKDAVGRPMPGKLIAVEHFFDYEQVADVAITRAVETDDEPKSRIHLG